MMPPLAHQHCLNHGAREAVAQCPECHYYFCRECIVEHDDRVLCGSCLRKLTAPKTGRWRPGGAVTEGALALVGCLMALLFFYWIGQWMLTRPSQFHDTTVWKSAGGGEE